MKIIFLFVFISVVFAEDELEFDGECPEEIPTVENFDYDKFSGLWYEIKRYPNSIINEQCAVVRYVPLPYNNYNLTYLSRNTVKERAIKRELVYDKEAINSPDMKYDVYFKCKKDNYQHLILDTDYKTYSVVWGCVYNKKKEINTQRLFIYSRTKTIDDEILQQIELKLEQYGINHSKLEGVEQKQEECGNIIAETPIWEACPETICSNVYCKVEARFGN